MICPEVSRLASNLSCDLKLGIEHLSIIAIDGLCGTGKSSLAKQLFCCFWRKKIRLVRLDEYITDNSDKGYFNYLNWNLLETSFRQIKNRGNYQLLIVEGILILKILDRLEYEQAKLIYVEPQNDNPIAETYQRINAHETFSTTDPIDNEIIAYHLEYEPHLVADRKFKFEGSWRD